MTYTCPTCKQEHEDLPAIAFNTPSFYNDLTEQEKNKIAEINSDFSTIQRADRTDRFIKAVLFQKVNGHCEPLQYGVWVSLSEKSFNDYKANFYSNDYEAIYFGYLSNWLPGSDNTLSLHTNVQLSKGGNRPEVIPHKYEHPFVQDYYNGISQEEAEKRVTEAFKG